jgi:hypothetical protein
VLIRHVLLEEMEIGKSKVGIRGRGRYTLKRWQVGEQERSRSLAALGMTNTAKGRWGVRGNNVSKSIRESVIEMSTGSMGRLVSGGQGN